MEHLSTFGLTRDPFASDPQPGTAFPTATAADVQRRLARAAMQGKGLCLVTGEGGVGKSLVVRQLLESLEEEVFEACMLVPVPGITDGRWILSRFARQLGVEEPADDLGELLGQVYEQMAIVREDGRHTVLLIDEGQVLADAGLLPVLRGLLNLEYEEKRLVSLVLVGLPSLGDAVDAEPSLRDRVELRLKLTPLSADESAQYVAHRIRAVEGTPAILESGAMSSLVKWGGGLPRRLNTLADNSLFEAHLAGRMSATAEDVERAAADLGVDGATESPVAPAAPVAAPLAPRPVLSSPVAEPTPELVEAPELPPIAAATVRPDPGPSALDDMFEESSRELELSEVVAADTNPTFDAGATIAIMPDEPEAGMPATPEATVALLDETPFAGFAEPSPAARSPQAPDATIAIFDDVPPATPGPSAAPDQTIAILDDLNENTDGELDDLFADLVDD